MTLQSWSTADVDALLSPFQEDITGVNDTLKAVVLKRFTEDNLNPRQPHTRHFYILEIRTADLPKVGDLKGEITVRTERVNIRQIADEGNGVTRIICG